MSTTLQTPILLALACLATAVAAWAATGMVRRALIRRRVLDAPNRRSSHAEPKPRGGGLAVMAVIAAGWSGAAATLGLPAGAWTALAVALGLSLVSFLDDLREVPPAWRFGAQIIAVAAVLASYDGGPVFQGWLPLWLDRLLAGLAWLWFVNLFNFMDGIDGISGVETIALGLGLALVGLIAAWPVQAVAPPLLVAAAAAGFLVWNWQPSRIFLGDAGSIGLGFLLGWLLLDAAAAGLLAAALILPGYYLLDATRTLLRRLLRGERVWRAHREHAYQHAVDAGWSHARAAGCIAGANVLLVGCALLAAGGWPILALALAVLVVAGLLRLFDRAGQGSAS